MKLQVVFSTANFVYKLKKSENFEKRRYNANGNANTGVEFRWSWGTAILALEKFELMRAPQQFQ